MKKLPDKVKALYKSSILIVLINLTVLCSTAFGQSTGEASPESPGLKVAQDDAVIWESPGKSSMDCVPLGNGDIGLNAWTEGDNDLVFYISKTDAWDDNGRLCKVGKLRVTFSNSPFAKKPFREVLSVAKGQLLITSGDKNNKTSVRLWVDANNPVIHLESSSSKAIDIKASMELWRTEEYEIKTSVSDLRSRMGKLHKPTIMKPDTIIPAKVNTMCWFHWNQHGLWREAMEMQSLDSAISELGLQDPLQHRIWGAVVKGEGFTASTKTSLKSQKSASKHHLSIAVLGQINSTPEKWQKAISSIVKQNDSQDLEKARNAHEEWWKKFWQRSWIIVTQNHKEMPFFGGPNLHLMFGGSQNNRERFEGYISRASLYSDSLNSKEIKRLAADKNTDTPKSINVLSAAWKFDKLSAAALSPVTSKMPKLELLDEVELTKLQGQSVLNLSGKGHLRLSTPDLAEKFTIEAWIRPTKEKSSYRIFDMTPVGKGSGFLLDLYKGRLRVICKNKAFSLPAGSAPVLNKWTHLALTINQSTGAWTVYQNGQLLQKDAGSIVKKDTAKKLNSAEIITRGYTLHRYMVACSGRGAQPIKFNGSIFTVETAAGMDKDPDYRRWGPGYWFQNTRLIYWSMLMSGDWDFMHSFFDQYVNALPLREYNTKKWYGHAGAWYPETMMFWGALANDTYGWRSKSSKQDIGYIGNQWVRYEIQGQLELAMMMLDYYEFSGDESFLKEKALPLITSVLTYYHEHFKNPRDRDGKKTSDKEVYDETGKYILYPLNSLEMYWGVTNAAPDIAGLMAISSRLATLPKNLSSSSQRTLWNKVAGRIPALPMREKDGKTLLGFHGGKPQKGRNVQNPELQALFPFRLHKMGKVDMTLAQDSFNHRVVKKTGGWFQDSLHAAMVGDAKAAWRDVLKNFSTSDKKLRYPAMWGPNYDFTPDHDHGGISSIALQHMLVQYDKNNAQLFPAWPSEYDVHFKLRGPQQSTLECKLEKGKIVLSKVHSPQNAKKIKFSVADQSLKVRK
ncbi:MAG: DUF5703 domain-containing protein [Lentisphaerales bacterium]|nr:DUF5703 domain-containing protein [Lentisphaerales bacterium]